MCMCVYFSFSHSLVAGTCYESQDGQDGCRLPAYEGHQQGWWGTVQVCKRCTRILLCGKRDQTEARKGSKPTLLSPSTPFSSSSSFPLPPPPPPPFFLLGGYVREELSDE